MHLSKETINILKSVFIKTGPYDISSIKVEKICMQYPFIDKELNDILIKVPQWISKRNLVYGKLNNISLSTCKTCGKYLKFKCKGSFCSRSCAVKNKETQEKIVAKSRERYGVDRPAQSKEIQDKIKQTCLEKYGCNSVLSSNKVRAKIEKTCLVKYGTNIAAKSYQVKEKIKNTNQEKYHANSITCLDSTKIKIRNKAYSLYNVKSESTNRAIEKIFNKTFGVIPLFTKDEFNKRNDETHLFEWKCTICGKVFKSPWDNGHLTRKCTCQLNAGTSKGEQELIDFCKQFYPNLIEHDRILIKPYELDIVIPERRIAIEFNGCYYHSLEAGTPLGYHLMKTEMCEKLGYRLIHIWEDEWQDITKNKLKRIFNNSEIKDSLILNRDWFSINDFSHYEIKSPKIVIRNGFHVEDCGSFILIRR